MKYKIKTSKLLKKSYKLAKKRGLDVSKLKYIIELLAFDEKLDIKLKDHRLISDKNYDNVRECHIEPDRLLIYKIEDIQGVNIN